MPLIRYSHPESEFYEGPEASNGAANQRARERAEAVAASRVPLPPSQQTSNASTLTPTTEDALRTSVRHGLEANVAVGRLVQDLDSDRAYILGEFRQATSRRARQVHDPQRRAMIWARFAAQIEIFRELMERDAADVVSIVRRGIVPPGTASADPSDRLLRVTLPGGWAELLEPRLAVGLTAEVPDVLPFHAAADRARGEVVGRALERVALETGVELPDPIELEEADTGDWDDHEV